jgi:hypothetical protein
VGLPHHLDGHSQAFRCFSTFLSFPASDHPEGSRQGRGGGDTARRGPQERLHPPQVFGERRVSPKRPLHWAFEMREPRSWGTKGPLLPCCAFGGGGQGGRGRGLWLIHRMRGVGWGGRNSRPSSFGVRHLLCPSRHLQALDLPSESYSTCPGGRDSLRLGAPAPSRWEAPAQTLVCARRASPQRALFRALTGGGALCARGSRRKTQEFPTSHCFFPVLPSYPPVPQSPTQLRVLQPLEREWRPGGRGVSRWE